MHWLLEAFMRTEFYVLLQRDPGWSLASCKSALNAAGGLLYWPF